MNLLSAPTRAMRFSPALRAWGKWREAPKGAYDGVSPLSALGADFPRVLSASGAIASPAGAEKVAS
ncbi:hypothetical protein GCM10008942_41660 [Rhizomicrobium electricum]|uniref:Uncharacterized protein n=1 Tax=Rhizomicrobium electricum TaxID=480070 RepID=A0ABP3QCJ6_9PROT